MTSNAQWIAIAAGGAGGAVLRHWMGGAVQRGAGSFPWGTLAVNLLGCAAIGAIAGFEVRSGALSPVLRSGLVVGLLGGFTTFSAFGLETARLVESGRIASAVAYVLLSTGIGVGAVLAVMRLVAGR